MGRAKLYVADALIAFFLREGSRAHEPVAPLHEITPVDARVLNGRVELLIEGPQLQGPAGATLDSAPIICPAYRLRPVIEELAAYDLALELLRIEEIAEPERTLSDKILPDPAAEVARRALKLIPTSVLERARAAHRPLGSPPTVDPGEYTDEVPGA